MEALQLIPVSVEGRSDEFSLFPELGGEESVGLGKSVESGLHEVLESLGGALGRGEHVLNTSELQNLLASGSTNDGSSSRSRDESHSNRAALSSDFHGHSVHITDLVTPISSSNGDQAELSDNKSTLDGNLDFLGDLDSEADISVLISNGNNGLEASSLSGFGLLLHGNDLHDFVT